jgi:hypothetical protein
VPVSRSPTDNLRVDWSFGLLNTGYDCTNQFSGTGEIIGCMADNALGAWPIDITVDAPIPFAPEFNTNFGVSYSAYLGFRYEL